MNKPYKSAHYQEWVNYVIEQIVNINNDLLEDQFFINPEDGFKEWVLPITPDDLSGYYPYITEYIDEAIDVSGYPRGYGSLSPQYLAQYGTSDEQRFTDLDIPPERPASETLGTDNLKRLYLEASQQYFNIVKNILIEDYKHLLEMVTEDGPSISDLYLVQHIIKNNPNLNEQERKYYSFLAEEENIEAFRNHILGEY